ncbi:serine protease [Chloropicon primus]|uniref:Pro-apoptotic serine protease NMA111 n=1 Tax=Chloropicon primus TaxID=1764295 RepID=A0A5B8MMN0_9CHLO|nr:serine protease [Chloropicon primus]UPR00940.1 serine protease [Chloropicon primus]|eukprot:QDZ21719.1 serine protease [Chloropicon primus]
MGTTEEGSRMEEGSDHNWQRTLKKVVPCVVVLKVTSARSFDTESAGSSFATGFIVDKERGLILTNRHVVKPGPITAEAVFLNREELPVYPLYRDPIHDFGFMRFDPRLLRFMEVGEVPLAPQAAQVGIEIRVVGNDSGEKISILAGTLARLDRDAPTYSSRGYNDFNTFYLQAASGTKGGSSGSPVIDVQGRAIGLNAGSKTKTASAFFLPLDRVVRALNMCKACFSVGENNARTWRAPNIPRGDLQATFIFKGFDEVKRLGVKPDTEALVRSHKRQKTETVGMLVVDSRVPKGPSDGKLEPGDVLVEINGETVTHFIDLEDKLDSNVDEEVSVSVVRGSQMLTYKIRVESLHRVTPACFLELSGGSIHALSYQQARNFSTPTGQVYVADPGYMLSRAGISKHSVILSVKGRPTPDVETLATVLATIPKGEQVPVQYRVFSDRFRKRQSLIYVDRKWYGAPTVWSRDDSAGSWHQIKVYPFDEEESKKELELEATHKSKKCKMSEVPESCDTTGLANGLSGKESVEDPKESISRSLLLVDVEVPEVALADGVHSKSFTGNGVLVYQDDKFGLVLVDRNTVAIGPCDIRLSFCAYPAELHGTVRFLHPLHNFALVSYDPRDLNSDALKVVKPCTILSDPPLSRGDKVVLVGLSGALRSTARDASVTNATAALNIVTAEIPRFHAVNEEVIELDQDFGTSFSGVLIDENASVRALWASFSRQVGGEEREFCAGIHSYTFSSWIDKTVSYLKNFQSSHAHRKSVPVPVMNVEFNALLLSKAANYGLSREWIQKLAEYDKERKQVLRVKSCVTDSNAKAILNEGDMILAVNDKLLSSFYDIGGIIDNHCSKCDQLSFSELKEVDDMKLTVFKDSKIQDVSFKLEVVDGLGTDRLLHWAGAQIQDSYRAVKERGFLPQNHGVYISRWHHGSPSHRYGMYALHWILEVNGKPTPDLDTFLKETEYLQHQSFVRVKLCHLDNKPKVITLRLDLRFWPTWELKLNHQTGEWGRRVIKSI